MRSMGIDLSLTGTAFVVLDAVKVETALKYKPKVMIAQEMKTGPTHNRFQRVEQIADAMLETYNIYKPDRVVFENYGVSKFQTGQIEIIELGGICRAVMWKSGVQYLDPRPSQLKKFVVGTGAAKKEQVMMWVFKRWGYEPKTNNIADAYGLACIGLAWAGQLSDMTAAMHEVVGDLKLY